ncbi:GntR family transcriptional regulator [Kitasatospora sp. MAP5-34]|uniref:GntR family transcriptional regulator n=1 Tax=Kitasatospora sp. MAP5-34 TaxID=3035102 RepID=UPI002473185B|nr:GntR family transcriptional regulator [Kitasatospora sp. MAP5-34]MDH6576498.1 GntR family transcriptional regulator [Kitasatospora sp. MAP5-34]
MIIPLVLTSEIPIYQQIHDRVVEGIASGTLPVGASLPSIRALAADSGINFHTVNKAYDLLRQEGLLHLTRKHGAVIARDHTSGPPHQDFVADWDTRARTLLAEARAHGLSHGDILDRCQALLTAFGVDGPPSAPASGSLA